MLHPVAVHTTGGVRVAHAHLLSQLIPFFLQAVILPVQQSKNGMVGGD